MTRLLVGGYGPEMTGSATGIGLVLAGDGPDAPVSGALSFHGDVATVDRSPSWLTRHPSLEVVYAALEGAGTVQAFGRVAGEQLRYRPWGTAADAGALACHVAVAPDGGFLLVSCWGDGRIVRYDLGADGALCGAPWTAPAAVDPYAEPTFDGAAPMAEGAVSEGAAPEPGDPDDRTSRTHQAVFLPRSTIATTDMGLDLVRLWTPSGRGLRALGEVVLPRGTGPRHAAWHPSGHLYVVTELSCELFVLSPTREGTWRVVSATALSPAAGDDDAAAEITLSRHADRVYVGLRGSDTIAVLTVTGDGSRPQPVALVEAGAAGPRHHVVLDDTLLVAGQLSHDVVSAPIDERTGIPSRPRHRAAVPSPTCLLPLPHPSSS